MSTTGGALFAALGALLIDLQLLYGSVLSGSYRSTPPRIAALLISEVFRIGIAAAIGATFAESGQISGAWAAVFVGAGVPLVVERLIRPVVNAASDSASTSKRPPDPDLRISNRHQQDPE